MDRRLILILVIGMGSFMFYKTWLFPLRDPDLGQKNQPASIPIKASYDVEKNIQLTFKLTNTTDLPIQGTFWSYLPLADTSNQQRHTITTTEQYHLSSEKNGQQKIHISLNNFAPFAQKIIKLNLQSFLAKTPNHLTELVHRPEHHKFKQLQSIAQRLKKYDLETTLNNTYTWLTENIHYNKAIKHHPISYSLKHKQANNQSISELAYGLLQANAIPSKLMGGFYYPRNIRLTSNDYQYWLEVWMDQRWVIMDVSKQNFINSSEHYIAFQQDPSELLFGASSGLHVEIM